MKNVILLSIILVATTCFTSCKKEANLKFAGYYSGSMNCSGSTSGQSVRIDASPSNGNKIIVYFDSHPLDATVSGNGFTIAQQTIYDSSGTLDVSGYGTLSGNNLNLSFSVYVHGSGYTDCTFTGAK